MTRAADVAELVLGEIRASEGAVFAGVAFRDEPILYTGAQMPGRVPARIGEMRQMARDAGWHSFAYGGAKLFYEQARFMEGFEDDCPYTGQFERYYPTYEDMSDRVLRGYFTWRARYRAGRVEDAPLSFLFVHAYELLCGIGTVPGMEGYRALESLKAAYGQKHRPLETLLSKWQNDYIVYHGLDLPVRRAGFSKGKAEGAMPFSQAVFTLRQAEEEILAGRRPACPQVELLEAFASAGRYRVSKSAALHAHRDELAESCVEAFGLLVAHCKKRRKAGFVEGAFGKPTLWNYRMFDSAVFFDPQPHAACNRDLGYGEGFTCQGGQWFRRSPCGRLETSIELGDLMHAVDGALRQATGDLPALKPRDIPAFLQKMALQAVEGVLARKAAEEAARVRIDRAALAGIRDAAAVTREALLVDEEREDALEPAEPPLVLEVLNSAEPLAERAAPEQPRDPAALEAEEPPPLGEDAPAPFGLSPYQARLVRVLLADAPAPEPPAGTTLDMQVDAANEALFDLVGDVVLEFEGNVPQIVEDYRDDLKEALG